MTWTADQALDHWEREKLLTKQKADELRHSLDGAEHDVPHRAIAIFSAVGAILVGLGIILFIASNWQAITPLMKTVILMTGLLATGGFGYWLVYEKHAYEKTGMALLFVNIFIFGASIFLIGQIYNLPLTYWWGMLLWFLGTALMAYVLESKMHLWLSVPLFIFFLGWLRTSIGFGNEELNFLFEDRGNILNLLPIIGTGILSLGILHRKKQHTEFGEGTLFHWGIFLILFTLVITTIDRQVFFPIMQLTWDSVTIASIVAASIAFLAAVFFGKYQTSQGRWALVALVTYMLFVFIIANLPRMMGFPESSFGAYYGEEVPLVFSGLYVLHVLLVFVALLTFTWFGTLLRMAGVINLGITALGITIIIQYFSWAFERLDQSFAFILGGLLILGLSALLERQRRKLVASINKAL